MFQSVPVVGRLKDLKFQVILFKVEPDTCLGDSSSSDEDYASGGSGSSSECVEEVEKSFSHTETEKSHESDYVLQ